jgi:isobutyryl-CoA mutase
MSRSGTPNKAAKPWSSAFSMTFRNLHGEALPGHIELARSTEEEKQSPLKRVANFHAKHAADATAMAKRL